jgi:hypothetical protein
MTKKEINKFIREAFEQNYERLKMESAHGLSPNNKRMALQQVLLYYQKLGHIAESVTDTEVKLTLPEQISPNGNKFAIEGVVDVVRETGKTTMYDIKTHDAEMVRQNISFYEKQLNVYAYIWQELRGEELDETAVICTQVPNAVHESFQSREMDEFMDALNEWEPLVPIDFNQQSVNDTIRDFADIVDKIEAGIFHPAPLSKLKSKEAGMRNIFASHVCRNCDARYSCSSYREYSIKYGRSGKHFMKYFSDLGDSKSVTEETASNITGFQALLNVEEELGNWD